VKKKNNVKSKVLTGKSISTGYTIGNAYIYKDILTKDLYFYSIQGHDIEAELKRIKQVFDKVIRDLKKVEKNVKKGIGKNQGDIFEVHAQILKDKTLIKDIENELKNELVNAEHAVRNVFRKWADKFKNSRNERTKSKADDLMDISRRVLCSFMDCDVSMLENIPPESIIIAKRLLPSDTVRLNRKNAKGIIVEQGSNVSHSAIIARSLGVPALADVKDAVSIFKTREQLILDGCKGQIIKNPTSYDIDKFKKIIHSTKKTESALIKEARRPSKTKDGIPVKVYANVASIEDAKVAKTRGMDGIGLLRIELLYMSSKTLPDEQYLIKELHKILRPARDKIITFRLLDIGSDKNIPYIELESEQSPALGLRGIRLLLKYKNLLRAQLRSVIVLSKDYNIRILVPIVSFQEEIQEVREIAKEIIKQFGKNKGMDIKNLKIGAMIEIPAAVENIEKIAKVSDFLSIGTNDLIQYSIAAGRDNPSVSEYYKHGSKLAIKYIRKIVKSANRHGIECSICGEMAGDTDWITPLFKTGIRAFSVSPYLVPLVKAHIRKITD
jgi:phosphoenolpyruvate-protein phosphotransferase